MTKRKIINEGCKKRININYYKMKKTSNKLSHWLVFLIALIQGSLVAQVSKPNIIFLLADDQCTYSMGCYGNPDVRTPHMDMLANEGVIFDNHYNTSAICMASRASIMTGKYEYVHGTNFGHGNMRKEVWEMSYPVLLKKAGYFTAFAGKFGFEVKEKGICESDFDMYGGSRGQTKYKTSENKSMLSYADDYPHSTLSYGAFGQDVIKEAVKQNKPFCLSISFKAPHRPVEPDPKFNDIYRGKNFTKPGNFGREYSAYLSPQSKTGRQWKRFSEWNYDTAYDTVMAKYNQLVYGIDVAIGMIMDELDQMGIAENTVIIYSSDNGYICGSHGYASKVLPLEESSRAPLIIYDPRMQPVNQHKICEALTGNIDIAPSILELAGIPVPEEIEGKSLLPLLKNDVRDIRTTMTFINDWGTITCTSLTVLQKDWKYTYWWYQDENMSPFEELFNTRDDPLELKNLAKEPEVKKIMAEMRSTYDLSVSVWKRDAVAYNDYMRFGILYDRNIPWSEKEPFLKTK